MTDQLSHHELRFDRLLDADSETVWRYLTDDALRARWFMGGESDLRVGGSIGFTMDHDRLSDAVVPTPEKYRPSIHNSWSERITRFDPPRLIAFEWEDGEAGEVTITLTPEGARTRLTLVHTGLRGRDDAVNFGGGWASHLAVLERRLRGERVPSFWALHAEAEARVAAALG